MTPRRHEKLYVVDAKSFHDYVRKNATAIAAAVKKQARERLGQ